MKILLNQTKYSEKFVCLTNALHEIKGLTIGVANGELDSETVISYKPDLIICDDVQQHARFSSMRILTVLCCIGGNIDLSSIGPCVDVTLFKNLKTDLRYKCDIVFFGNPNVFDNELLRYLTGRYKVKIFNPTSLNTPYYCGVIPRDHHPIAYRTAKISPFSLKEEESRLYEIYKSGGNPVIYDPGRPNEFHEKIDALLKDEFSALKEHIGQNKLDEVSNTHVLSEELKKLGFEKLSSALLRGSL